MQNPSLIHVYAQVTRHSFEAMIYYLYTGEVNFAPFSSDPRPESTVEARAGNWNMAMTPSPSAKSIYRLADKVPCLTRVWRSPLGSPISV